MRKQKSTDFFRTLYEPVLEKAGNKDVLMKKLRRSRMDRLFTPEVSALRLERCKSERKLWWDSLTPEQRRERLLYLNAAKNRVVTAAKRSAYAAIASKARWSKEPKEGRSERMRKLAQARWMKVRWPFSERSK